VGDVEVGDVEVGDVVVRRLGPGDEAVLTQLARSGARFEEAGVDEPQEVPLAPADAARFLADDRTHLFVAFDGADTVLGFVVVNELLHRHTFSTMLLVYEIGVDDAHRRRGIGRALLDAVRALAVERGIPEGFVLTEATNGPAMALYASAGGTRLDAVEWDFVYGASRF
jgi:ribosomal protein S18 acetylase RimI-like enzyme